LAYYERYKPTEIPFAQQIGEPSEFDAALGQLVIGFQELEATISLAIGFLLPVDRETTAILTAELSFKVQVHLLVSLTKHKINSSIQADSGDRLSQLEELSGLCLWMEAERNRMLHSFWPASHQTGSNALRVKRTAKKEGLRESRELLDAGQILDLADYSLYLCTMVEEFYELPFHAADQQRLLPPGRGSGPEGTPSEH
jgi:hypothetical protein